MPFPKKCAAFLFPLLLSACNATQIKVGNYTECTVAGVFQAGMDCAETNTSKISTKSPEQMIEFLEPQPARPDPENPGEMLPARAGAVCRSDEDFTAQKTALEQACAALGKKCSTEIKSALRRMGQKVRPMLENAKNKRLSLEPYRLDEVELGEEKGPF